MLKYTATWPGIYSIVGFNFSFGPGIQPSTCVISSHVNAVDLNTLAQYDTLRIVGGDPNSMAPVLEFPDALLESPLAPEGKATMLTIPIKDRRWRWRFGAITGNYNQRQPNGTYLREKTPQELATLCLEAMGETGYDISRLPNGARLPRLWVAENPAQELDKICRDLGCWVVLNPATNNVEIWPIGTSRSPSPFASYPSGVSQGDGITVAAKPGSIAVYGGESLFQSAFELGVPLGWDTDGQLKHIDALSYAPDDGWKNEPPDLPSFQYDDRTYDDPFTGEKKRVRDLALGSVWRIYGIGELAIGGYSPAGMADYTPQTINDLDLRDFRLDKQTDTEGREKRVPSQVIGRRYLDTINGETADEYARVDVSYSIDTINKIVVFAQPVYKYAAEDDPDHEEGDIIKADLYLECAFTGGEDGERSRYIRVETVDGGAGERPVHQRELVREVVQRFQYDENGATPQGPLEDNAATLHPFADNRIDGVLGEYEPQLSATQTRQGIHAVSPDGNLRQVSWTFNKGGTYTTFSAAQQHNPYVPTVETQRRQAAADAEAQREAILDDLVKQFTGVEL